MKKLLLLFVVIVAVLVSSCSKDEPEVKDEPTIVGKWGYQFEDWFIYTFTYEFKSDGTGTSHMHRTGEEGDPEFEVTYDIAYSINGDKLTLTSFCIGG